MEPPENRTAGSACDSDDFRTVLRTLVEKIAPKEQEQNAISDVLMTMSQSPVPDVVRELAEAPALHALFAALQGNEERS